MDDLIQKYLSADPQIHFGKPCFRGTRIPVYLVLEMLEGGISPEEIVGENYYPQLTPDHVRAALHFAAEIAKNQSSAYFEKSA